MAKFDESFSDKIIYFMQTLFVVNIILHRFEAMIFPWNQLNCTIGWCPFMVNEQENQNHSKCQNDWCFRNSFHEHFCARPFQLNAIWQGNSFREIGFVWLVFCFHSSNFVFKNSTSSSFRILFGSFSNDSLSEHLLFTYITQNWIRWKNPLCIINQCMFERTSC